MGKVSFGDKWGVEFTVPALRRYARVSKNESIIIFDTNDKGTKARMCLGIGTVHKVEKGNKVDVVYMNFGRKYTRRILVIHNQARRQVYLLKRGQIASFFGFISAYKDEEGIKTTIYANGFNPWYVPKAMDIKGYDTDQLDELTKENENNMLNFLDDILEEK